LVYKSQVRKLFHAHIKIKLPVFCEEGLFDEFFSILEEINRKYNSYSNDSYFDRINKNAGKFVEVNNETIRILKEIFKLSDFFDQEYDITIMPLIRLWGFYKDNERKKPTPDNIKQALKKVDYQNIEIKEQEVRINKDQEIITGSFIKSYAVDKLVQKIKSKGITDAIINAGGSTIMAINNKVHPVWKIDITHPQDKNRKLFTIGLNNACFSTSAQSNTFVEIDGRKYGHILSPVTGYPSENKQIGVITESCFTGDIISTGLFNQSLDGFSEKMEKLAELYPVSGFLLDKNDSIRFYGDFEKRIIE